MSAHRKFIVYGPADTLDRMVQSFAISSKPAHRYGFRSADQQETVDVLVFEEKPKLHQPNRSVTVIVENSARSLKFDVMTTGGRAGFRSAITEDVPIHEQVTNLIIEYAERLGLTIQETYLVESETGS